MLKHTMTYTDFNDRQVTKDFYFNISKAEVVELEIGHEGGYGEHLKRIVESNEVESLIKEFKALLLLAYGEKSADGEHFLKGEEISKKFTQSAAYSDLFMKLATDSDFAVEFVTKVMPGDIQANIKSATAAVAPATPQLPPPVASI